jgi:serine/threonine-protein kinase
MIGSAAALVAVLGTVAVTFGGGDDTASGPATTTTAAQVPAAPVTTMQTEPSPSTAPPPAPAPAPIVAADALPGLLLSADEVSQRLNTPGMTAMPVETNPLAGTVNPPNCSGVWGPAYASTYNGSGFTGLAVQGVFLQPAAKVAQAVVAPGAIPVRQARLTSVYPRCPGT